MPSINYINKPINVDITVFRVKEVNGNRYIYAKVGDWYGWYELTPVETPEELSLDFSSTEGE